jgi:hypothetical protein
MATLNFSVAYNTTLESVQGMTPNIQVYADEINDCSVCQNNTGSCWACLSTDQQVFSNPELTSPVADGYYMVIYTISGSQEAIWHIVGGYPQGGGFYN